VRRRLKVRSFAGGWINWRLTSSRALRWLVIRPPKPGTIHTIVAEEQFV
jgi:hypothetical protein